MTFAEGKIAEAGMQAQSYGRESYTGFMDAVKEQGNRVMDLFPHPTRDEHKRTRYGLGYMKGESVLEFITQ